MNLYYKLRKSKCILNNINLQRENKMKFTEFLTEATDQKEIADKMAKLNKDRVGKSIVSANGKELKDIFYLGDNNYVKINSNGSIEVTSYEGSTITGASPERVFLPAAHAEVLKKLLK